MKKTLSILMCFLLIISTLTFVSIPTSAATYSGSCGDDLTWSLDTSKGILNITGSGDMTNYVSYSSVPWCSYSSYVKTVTIGNNVTSIGSYAFEKCYSLTSVIIGNSVTSIGDSAFSDCTSLTSVTIGNSVTSIERYAFNNCDSLTSVTIPNSVTSIGISAFNNCDLLETVTIGNSVTTIGSYAFRGCTSLSSVTIPNSVTSIGFSAFNNCDSLTNITVKSGNQNYSSADGVLFNKNKTTLIQYPIGNTRTSYTIPNTVTTIGSSAFYSCDSLESVTIPNSVTSIGGNAFAWCTSLTSITIPNSVTSIGSYAFNNCDSLINFTVESGNQNYSSADGVLFNKNKTMLIQYPIGNTRTSYTIPSTVTSIGDSAFSYCDSLESVTIGNSVTSIGDSAFSYCDSLEDVYYNGSEDEWERIKINSGNTPLTNATIHYNYVDITEYLTYTVSNGEATITDCDVSISGDITIPSTLGGYPVTSIGREAFYSCDSLTSVTIPNSVTSIGDSVFSHCGSLTSITIPNSVTSIGISAFINCNSLTSVTIPNSVTSIGSEAFSSCDSLTNITVESGNQNYSSSDGVLFNKNKTTLIQYPIGNTRTSYTIPSTVTSIGNNAFSYCESLETVTIPNSVTSIGYDAFLMCESLTSVIIPNGVTSIGNYAFSYCFSLKSITIPNSVTSIGDWAFYYSNSLTDVYYTGSVKDWENISIGNNNTCLTNATIHYNYGKEEPSIPTTTTTTKPTTTVHTHSYKKTVVKQANCTQPGNIKYACTCGAEYYESISATGHKYASKIIKASTCSETGMMFYECTVCKNQEFKSIAKKAHTVVVDKGYAATCLKRGKTDGSHCKVCKVTITEQKEIAIKKHVFTYKTQKATYFEEGYKRTVCGNCNLILGNQKIDKLVLSVPKFKLTKGKKQFKVKYTAVSGATGFQVRYKIKGKWKTKTFDSKKTVTKVIKKLKKGTYQVEVRAFVKQDSKKAYSAWAKPKKVKVK